MSKSKTLKPARRKPNKAEIKAEAAEVIPMRRAQPEPDGLNTYAVTLEIAVTLQRVVQVRAKNGQDAMDKALEEPNPPVNHWDVPDDIDGVPTVAQCVKTRS